MKYYLAGPMSGLRNFNYDTFTEIAEILRQQGLDVASPHEIFHDEISETRGTKQYKVYLAAGLRLLLSCDAIIMLPGWRHSKGARVEIEVAHASSMEIFYYVPSLQQITKSEPPRLSRWSNNDGNSVVRTSDQS